MAGIYKSRYSGAEIDQAIKNALTFDPAQNGWERLASGVNYPININDLIATGNYIMDYFINGPEAVKDISPINVSIIEVNNTLVQFIMILDNVYYRIYDENDNTYPDVWFTKKTSNYIYIEEIPESPEPNGLLISQNENGDYTLNIYDIEKGEFVPVSTPDVMLGKVYDTEGRETDFFQYADEIYQMIAGSSIGLQWNAIDNTDVFGYAIACLKYVSERPNEYIVTFKDSSKVIYHIDGVDNVYDLGVALTNPQIIAYLDEFEEISLVHVYDTDSDTIYTSEDKCATWVARKLSEIDMYFDALNMSIRMTSPKVYGIQTRNINNYESYSTYKQYFLVEFTVDGSKYFAKCVAGNDNTFILENYVADEAWLQVDGYTTYKNAIMTMDGRFLTSADYMNPDTDACELVYGEVVEDIIRSTWDPELAAKFTISAAKEYTQRPNGDWYLRPVVEFRVKDVVEDSYEIISKQYLTGDEENFVAFSNFIDCLGTYAGYGITDTGKIVVFDVYVDTEFAEVYVTTKELSSVENDYTADAMIYDINSVSIFRHKDTYPISNDVLVSSNGDDILVIATEHFTNQTIHFNKRDRAALLLRETKQGATSKLYTLQRENQNYVEAMIFETNQRYNEMQGEVNLQTQRLDSHINDTGLHSTREKQEYWNKKSDPDHKHICDDTVEIDASKIVSGIIDMARLPKGAKDHIKKVQTIDEMLALTIDDVQNGDRVAVKHANTDPGTPEAWDVYEVEDDTKLGTLDAFLPASAGTGTYIDWENVEKKPTSIEGYGITDAYNKTDTEKIIDEKIAAESEKLNERYYEYDIAGMYETIHDTDESVKNIESQIEEAIAISNEVNAQRIEYNDLMARMDAMSEDMAEMEAVVDSLIAVYN